VCILCYRLFPAITTAWQGGHDFRCYRAAALAAARGLDPYDDTILAHVSGVQHSVAWLYPPLLATLLHPLTRLDLATAAHVWTALSLAALALTGWLVSRMIADPHSGRFVLAAACLWPFGLHAAIASGNIEPLVGLGVWSAAALALAGHHLLFGVALAAACVARPTGLVFALLPLVLPGRRKPDGALLAVGLIAAWWFCNALLLPGRFAQWLDLMTDPAWLSLPKTGLTLLGFVDAATVGAEAWTPWFALVLLAAICALAVRVLAGVRAASDRMVFAVTTLVLISPRLADYAYPMFIPALAWVAAAAWQRGGRQRALLFGAALVLLAASPLGQDFASPAPQTALEFARLHVPWLSALTLWLVCARRCAVSHPDRSTAPPDLHLQG